MHAGRGDIYLVGNKLTVQWPAGVNPLSRPYPRALPLPYSLSRHRRFKLRTADWQTPWRPLTEIKHYTTYIYKTGSQCDSHSNLSISSFFQRTHNWGMSVQDGGSLVQYIQPIRYKVRTPSPLHTSPIFSQTLSPLVPFRSPTFLSWPDGRRPTSRTLFPGYP